MYGVLGGPIFRWGTRGRTTYISEGTVTLKTISIRAASVACVMMANAAPATAVTVSASLGELALPPYPVALPPGSAYIFDHRQNGDAVTVMLVADAAGNVTWQAAATPNGGNTESGSGSI
jgi:hypothetical protein